jgi:hypothetical protein
MSAAQIEQVTRITRTLTKPPIQAALGFLASMFFGAIISLITSAFLQRHALDQVKTA